MATTLEKLLVIQDRDRKIARIRKELDDIPARRAQVEFAVKDHKEALEAAEEDCTRIQLKIKEQEGEIEQRKAKIADYRVKQMQVKTNDEYRAMNNQIFNEEKEVKALEENEIKLMEELEVLKAIVAEKQAELDEEMAGIADDLGVLEKRSANLSEQLSVIEEDRSGLVADMDDRWLSAYERIMRNKKDSAVVAIQGKTCTGCYMNVTPQTIHHARNLDTLTSCEYCGRIVYLMD